MTREELYQLVWSKPVFEVSKALGLSDVGLAKRCRRLVIPVPPRGYWACVAVGRAPAQIPLPPRQAQTTDVEVLTFGPPREKKPRVSLPQPSSRPAESEVKAAIGATKRTALLLERPWARDLTWDRGEKSGPVFRIEVSEEVVDRALMVCDRVVTAAALRGWVFRSRPPPDPPNFGQLEIDGEPVDFRIQEGRRQVPHVATREEETDAQRFAFVRPPDWDLVPTGVLRLQILDSKSRAIQRSWKETRRTPLDQQIPSILTGFLEYVGRVKVLHSGRQQAELEEQHRRRMVSDLSERRRANAQLIHQFEIQAGAWYRARLLRVYLRALESANPGIDQRFVEWARHYIEQLDPLSATPHDSELKDDRSAYHRPGERCLEDLARLIGHHWQEALKVHR